MSASTCAVAHVIGAAEALAGEARLPTETVAAASATIASRLNLIMASLRGQSARRNQFRVHALAECKRRRRENRTYAQDPEIVVYSAGDQHRPPPARRWIGSRRLPTRRSMTCGAGPPGRIGA